MTVGDGVSPGEHSRAARTSQLASQSAISSHHSRSLPPTPRQHARDYSHRSRTPSPSVPVFNRSPRSANSEASRAMPILRPTQSACRYQSTQTSRRRMPYTIGTDMLKKEADAPRRSLDEAEERRLCTSMDKLYDQLLPTSASESNRIQVADKIRRILREEWPSLEAEVSIFGSSGNLLFTNESDVDICIIVRGLETVCALAALLAKRGMRNVTCVHAKSVPIVKVWDPEFEVACDLNVNNLIALRNTEMVKAYMELDPRVRPLAMIVKYWTNRRIINEASGGTLSSYTWTLLLINFLQTRPTPILPAFSLKDETGQQKATFTKDLDKSRGYGAANKETIGQLLFHFFRRYGHEIDYETVVVSVRTGGLLTKAEKHWLLANNNRFCVEEPFNTDRNLANTADDTAFRGLHLEIRRAFELISNAADLVAGVCEPFEFSTGESRTIFERPQPQPRPILSRSTSQSGRANRGGNRGNRRGQETRNGPSGRRSSSAAAFGHTAFLNMQGSQIDVPVPDYFLQQRQPTSFSSEELSRLSRQITAEQQSLRLRQAQLAQAQLQQTYANSQSHSASSSVPRSARHLYNAYPSPRLMSLDLPPPGSAPLYPPYPFGPQFESPVTASYASSQQGTSTNPSSPLLTPATPYRRGMQRNQQASSSVDAVRSHSQPARPLPPPLSASIGPRMQYQPMTMPPVPANASRSAYIGPYMGPYGSFYVPMPTAESLPRDYLGYGIGGSPQSASASQAQTPAQVPVPDDALSSSQHLLPLQKTFSIPSALPELPRSLSPLTVSSDVSTNLTSAPTSTDSGQRIDSRVTQQLALDTTPMIVNGSSASKGKMRVSKERTGMEDRRVSDPTSGSRLDPGPLPGQPDLRRSPQSFASRVGASLAQHEQRRHEFQRPNFLNAEELDEPVSSVATPMASLNVSNVPAPAFPLPQMPAPPRPTDKRRSPKELSPDESNDNRRSPGSSRPAIPSLDLGVSSGISDRPVESRPSGHFLSPVQETRTPSPTSTRKHGHAKANSFQWNGLNGASSSSGKRDSSFAQASVPPPARRRSFGEKNGTNGISAPPASARSGPGPSKPVPSPQQQSNAWQPAKSNKKGKSKKESDGTERRGGGHVMPHNIAERKGG